MTQRWLSALRAGPLVRAAREAARDFKEPVFIVGGALRDAALKRKATAIDLDLALARRASSFAKHLAKRLGGTLITLHDATQVFRVALKGEFAGSQIDVAQFQGKDLNQDLARRDFTLNAMAAALDAGALIDPFNGIGDIKKKRVRMTAPGVLRADPLRVLRAYRLAAQFGLRLDPATQRAIRISRGGLKRCAPERIHAEVRRLLEAGGADWLKRLDKTGLLTTLFPELEPSRRCAEVYYGKGGVLKHSLAVVERLDFLLANLKRVYPRLAGQIAENIQACPGGTVSHAATLRLAALLHDVAKPATAKKIGGRLRFFGHDTDGAQMSRAILERLRGSREEAEWIAMIVHHHLRPGNLAANRLVSDKAVFRFFRDTGEKGVSLLLVCWADHASYLSLPALRAALPHISKDPHTFDPKRVKPATRKTLFHLQVVSYLLDRWFSRPEISRPQPLLNGNDVMKALRAGPGPRIGEILRALSEAQATGRIKTREDALRHARRLSSSPRSK